MLSIILSLFYALPNMVFMISYVSGISSFQMPLSAKEEKEYLQKYAEGDKDARNILIERNLRLVAHVVKKYSSGDAETDDLISIGTIGLIKAISTFKPNKGTRLATYAARCIDNEILMSLRANKKRQNEVLLQDPVGKDKDGKEITLIDKLSDTAENVFDEVDTRLQMSALAESMKYILTSREKKIIELRYGLADGYPYTQRDVAKMLRISRSYVYRHA
ncbi:MAG: RNA polymerase sporulation sigma factor SigK [Clostridia bacterium]|nr:RNA polymerase sporulation sigma factor SigK [Clostridia bacterium]